MPDLSTGFVVRATNSTEEPRPFIRDKLFLSIYSSCQHRPAALREAAALTETIIANLNLTTPSISSKTIADTAITVLNRFDPVAATVYSAYHPAS